MIAQKWIKAPFAGRVGLRNVDLGQYVGVGMTLITLQQLDPIYADFPLPEQALSTLKVGQQVAMRVDALSGREFHGTLKAIDARVSAESPQCDSARRIRQSRPRAVARHVRHGDGRRRPAGRGADRAAHGDHVQPLWRQHFRRAADGRGAGPAGTPTVKAGEAAAAPVPAAPASAFAAQRRFVRVGETRGERVEVLEGVKAGEQVVVAGQIKLQNISPVVIGDAPALPPPAETPKP